MLVRPIVAYANAVQGHKSVTCRETKAALGVFAERLQWQRLGWTTRKQFAGLEVLVAAEGGVVSAEELLGQDLDVPVRSMHADALPIPDQSGGMLHAHDRG